MQIFNYYLISLILFIIAVILINNWRRQNKSYSFSIYKNCLLTKYPIIFLSGRSSLFYSGKYWNCIPEWLDAHGYEVIDLPLSRFKHKRTQELSALLELSKNIQFHFISDESNKNELEWLANHKSKSIKSTWIVSTSKVKNTKLKTLILETQTTSQWYWSLIIKLHSFLAYSIHPEVLCIPYTTDVSKVARQYLSWAISLAESDLS